MNLLKRTDNIEKTIGTELFKRVFKCILTDNGGEFQRPDELETSIDGSKRCWIFTVMLIVLTKSENCVFVK